MRPASLALTAGWLMNLAGGERYDKGGAPAGDTRDGRGALCW